MRIGNSLRLAGFSFASSSSSLRNRTGTTLHKTLRLQLRHHAAASLPLSVYGCTPSITPSSAFYYHTTTSLTMMSSSSRSGGGDKDDEFGDASFLDSFDVEGAIAGAQQQQTAATTNEPRRRRGFQQTPQSLALSPSQHRAAAAAAQTPSFTKISKRRSKNTLATRTFVPANWKFWSS